MIASHLDISSVLPEAERDRITAETRVAIRALWENPERPLEEYESSRLLGGWLREHGFEVEYGVGGLPTAFRAGWGTGKPAIGFLAEYDALAGLANDNVAYRKPLDQAAGHACGHCLLGPANVAAAILVRHWLEATSTAGRVEVIGCPAEEILWGKVALLDRGVFDGLDILLTSHADYFNAVPDRPCQASRHGEWVFEGRAGHAGRDGAANALAGVEWMIQAMGWESEREFKNVRVSHAVRAGGVAPNIVPDRATVWWWFRGNSLEAVDRAYAKAEEIARRAARVTHTSERAHLISACRGYLPNSVVAGVLWAEYQEQGPTPWSAADIAWMRELSAAAAPGEPFSLERGIHLLNRDLDPYAQDDGEASWRIPLGRVNWAMPGGVPLHHWSTTALSGHPAGEVGALHCGRILAGAATRLLIEPERVALAREELERRRGETPLGPLEYAKNRSFFEQPEAFWEGSWTETAEQTV